MSTIAIDKEALRTMIREAVKKKLGTVTEMKRVENKSDKDVLKAFLAHQPAEGTKLRTDGQTLDGVWMGGSGIAQWQGDKIYTKDLGSKSAQIVQRALSKMAPPGMVMEDKKGNRDDKVGPRDDRKDWGPHGRRLAGKEKDKMDKKEMDAAKRRLKEALALLEGKTVTAAGSHLGKGGMEEEGLAGGVPGSMGPMEGGMPSAPPPAAAPAAPPAGGASMPKMEAGKPTVADPHAADELRMYMENDFGIWEGNQKKSIEKNLALKMKKGKYDAAQAPKLWMYLVDQGAQKYVKEFGSAGDRVDSIFNKATRMQVAAEFAKDFEQAVKTGEKDLDAVIAAI
jgi:hypothetical protein